jgi:hypothetical protein
MQQALQRSSLVPRGFVVESAYYEGDKAVIAVRASGSVGLCPSCGSVSRRIHSRYRRRVTDLPLSAGRRAAGDRTPLPLRRRLVRTPDLHRALRRRDIGFIGATHGETGLYRPSPRSGAWRSTGGRLRKTADAASEQGHAPARGPTPAAVRRLILSRSSASTTGPGGAIIDTLASSATWKGVG